MRLRNTNVGSLEITFTVPLSQTVTHFLNDLWDIFYLFYHWIHIKLHFVIDIYNFSFTGYIFAKINIGKRTLVFLVLVLLLLHTKVTLPQIALKYAFTSSIYNMYIHIHWNNILFYPLYQFFNSYFRQYHSLFLGWYHCNIFVSGRAVNV